MGNTVIVAAKRTPVLRIKKKWGGYSSMQLGAHVIEKFLDDAGDAISRGLVPDQVIMGNFAAPNDCLNPAKEACEILGFGVNQLNAFTVNKVCSSGLVSVMLGDALIRARDAECVIAGGMENLLSLTDEKMLSLLVADHRTGEMTWHAGDWCAKEFDISRAEQDIWALESYERSFIAQNRGAFRDEIVPFAGQELDEEPLRRFGAEVITAAELIPGCETITPLNSSKNAAGAAAVMLMNQRTCREYGFQPLAYIVGSASVGLGGASKRFTVAPPVAIEEALRKAGLGLDAIDLFFINTAFSSVTLYAQKKLGIPMDKLNVHGDAVSVGHPIGATGAKLLVEAVHALRNLDKRYAVISLCNAPAEATAMVIERA